MSLKNSEKSTVPKAVGDKVKSRISKRKEQENKARQIFRKKKNISYALIRTRKCAYQGVTNVRFSEDLACFVFLLPPFGDLPFYHETFNGILNG